MKDRTRAYTLGRLKHHVISLLGHKRVTEVGAGEIERFVRDVGAGSWKTRWSARPFEKQTTDATDF